MRSRLKLIPGRLVFFVGLWMVSSALFIGVLPAAAEEGVILGRATTLAPS